MKKKLIICIRIMILYAMIFIVFNDKNKSYALDVAGSKVSVNNPDTTQQTLKVLVIEINPLLNTITDTSRYPNNSGHPKVSEYFGQNSEQSLNEMVKDIQESSHGYLKVSLKKEWLNEFPTYKSKVKLNNGTTSNRFDEETYLKYAKYDGSSSGDWFNLLDTDIFGKVDAYSYDYEYIINKYSLVNRRNNGEFDQVWLLTVDPSQTYETNMIGKSAFWVNGEPIRKNCNNFLLLNVSISRRDANFHALGHGMEGILYTTFGLNYGSDYNKNNYNVNSISDYNKLKLVQKFFINSYNNSNSNFAGVGNIHFPFNGESDYDYSNTKKVYTNWRDWLNYPNISGNFVLDNNNAWSKNAGNDKLDSNQNKAPDRLYSRFWFYLMPHINGYTTDGYLNNWWKYLYSLDYVEKIKVNNSSEISVELDNYIPVNYTVTYNSGKKDTITSVKNGNNIHIDNSKVLTFKEGYLYASGIGTSKVTIYHDGKSISYNVTVKAGAEKTFTINFEKGNAKSIEKSSLSCKTVGKYCDIVMPKITVLDGYEIVGWGINDNDTKASYLPGKSYNISSNMTLYAITNKNSKEILITFSKNNAKSIEKDKASCVTSLSECIIKMPLIIPKDGYQVVGWSVDSNSKTAEYLPNKEYKMGENKTLYAITIQKENNKDSNHNNENNNSDNNSNKDYSLTLNIVDKKSQKCISNIKYEIKDSNNKIIYASTSTCNNNVIKMKNGKYTISQTKVPDEYATSKDVTFEVENNDIKLVIVNSPISICFKRNGNEKNQDSSYTIYDNDNKEIYNFDLSNVEHCKDYFKKGEYIIKKVNIQDSEAVNESNKKIVIIDDENIQTYIIDSEMDEKNETKKYEFNIEIFSFVFFILSIIFLVSSIVYAKNRH